jgi:hypothetical protein
MSGIAKASHGYSCVRLFAACGLVAFIVGWLCLAGMAVFDWSPVDLLHYFTHTQASEQALGNLISYQVRNSEEYRRLIPGITYKPQGNAGREGDEKPTDPPFFHLVDLLQEWPPDNTDPSRWTASKAHPDKGSGVRRFSFLNPVDVELAFKYRQAEVPFVLYNIPPLEETTDKFSLDRLLRNFGSTPRDVEKSKNNHFMYYKLKNEQQLRHSYPDWTPPQLDVPMTFHRFLHSAQEAESAGTHSGSVPLSYLTISATEGFQTPWIADALPYFSPKESLFVVDTDEFNGINCRFGLRGVIAEAHYDGHRNFVAMIRGRKRYMLLPPSECKNLHLLPRGHPSGRHSAIDWSDVEKVCLMNVLLFRISTSC